MKGEEGFSLLEVLVASSLLATALLGLAAMAVRGLEDATAARDELVAALLLRDFEGRIALTGGANAWRAPIGQAQAELRDWRRHVASAMPEGGAQVCRDSTPDDGRAGAPACDGGGGLVAKVFWRRGIALPWERRVLELAP